MNSGRSGIFADHVDEIKQHHEPGLFAGLGAAAAGLVVLFYFINMIAQNIPLRPLFIITSAFLFAMAIKFIGEAVQEFQEQSILPFTQLNSLAWLDTIGLNPTLEALSAQLLGDRVCAGDLFGGPAQRPLKPREQGRDARREAVSRISSPRRRVVQRAYTLNQA